MKILSQKIFKIISFFIFLSFTVSCAPVLKFKQLKPGRYALGKDPSFSLGNIKINPRLDLVRNKEKGFLGAVTNIAENLADTYSGSKYLKDSLEQVMRSEITSNQFASYSVNPLYKIDLLGTLDVNDTSEEKSRKIKKDGKEKEEKYYEIKRTYEVKLRYDIIRQKDGAVVGGNNHATTKSDFQEDLEKTEAVKKFNDWQEITRKMIEGLMPGIMKEILPYFTTVSVKLLEGDNKKIEKAGEIGEDGNIDSAKEMWMDLLNSQTLSDKDKSAVEFDIGACFEAKGDLENAEIWYKKCSLGEEYCRNGLSRLQERKLELERLKDSGL